MEDESGVNEGSGSSLNSDGIYYEEELSPVPEEDVQPSEEKSEREPAFAIGKPFLEVSHLKKGNPESELIILDWIGFLFSKNDIGAIINVLSYYVDLGWISEGVKNRLISYARGFIDGEDRHLFSEVQIDRKGYRIGKRGSLKEKTEEEGPEREKDRLMTSRDHIKSLTYILEILKDKIPEEAYEKIMERAEVGSEKSKK